MNLNRYCFVLVAMAVNIALSSCNGMDVKRDGVKSDRDTGYERFVREHRRPIECINIAEEASVRIERSPGDQCIDTLTSFDRAECRGNSERVPPQEFFDRRMEFSAPLSPNYSCPETLTSRSSSPCSLKEITSGRNSYSICIHEGRLVPLSWCSVPEGHCRH